MTVLQFCKDKEKLAKLEKELKYVHFIDEINEWVEKYDAGAPTWSNQADLRTSEMKYWFDALISRDLGAKILDQIITVRYINTEMYPDYRLPKEHNGLIFLKNELDFGKESLMCEYAYCINFQTNKLECYVGFNHNKEKEAELFKTTEKDIEAQKEYSYRDNPYYGCRLLKEYDLDNLPNKDDFIKELNNIEKSYREEEDDE
ncbi:hypothetical protein [uncultured Clostridium sp.]|uniref:hypothetical protein n=1 Tax=uncultured Clostridium sp. TaxID=59620 RepID=UPI002630DBA6|nr:hypothetical protein [uncultured Clostridium sp.]